MFNFSVYLWKSGNLCKTHEYIVKRLRCFITVVMFVQEKTTLLREFLLALPLSILGFVVQAVFICSS